jgi:threonine dehydratase
VLVGIQVPGADRKRFREYLDSTGYPYWDETENPVYGLFLGRD